eukprot:GHVR01021477.1.p1 GENE.GHVR01021477.1~~GHVR01021477.1.p1  ORF type:complete len:107 (+),score=3.47 GHVR01021477.1:494-814(+)
MAISPNNVGKRTDEIEKIEIIIMIELNAKIIEVEDMIHAQVLQVEAIERDEVEVETEEIEKEIVIFTIAVETIIEEVVPGLPTRNRIMPLLEDIDSSNNHTIPNLT